MSGEEILREIEELQPQPFLLAPTDSITIPLNLFTLCYHTRENYNLSFRGPWCPSIKEAFEKMKENPEFMRSVGYGYVSRCGKMLESEEQYNAVLGTVDPPVDLEAVLNKYM